MAPPFTHAIPAAQRAMPPSTAFRGCLGPSTASVETGRMSQSLKSGSNRRVPPKIPNLDSRLPRHKHVAAPWPLRGPGGAQPRHSAPDDQAKMFFAICAPSDDRQRRESLRRARDFTQGAMSPAARKALVSFARLFFPMRSGENWTPLNSRETSRMHLSPRREWPHAPSTTTPIRLRGWPRRISQPRRRQSRGTSPWRSCGAGAGKKS
jgi:hypothetical protein